MHARVLGVASLSRTCSEMSLERFGFSLARSAATPITASTSATTVVTESSTSAVALLAARSVRTNSFIVFSINLANFNAV